MSPSVKLVCSKHVSGSYILLSMCKDPCTADTYIKELEKFHMRSQCRQRPLALSLHADDLRVGPSQEEGEGGGSKIRQGPRGRPGI